jgi:hypothetical protein
MAIKTCCQADVLLLKHISFLAFFYLSSVTFTIRQTIKRIYFEGKKKSVLIKKRNFDTSANI